MVQDVQLHGSRRLIAAAMASNTSGEDWRRPEKSRRRSRPSRHGQSKIVYRLPDHRVLKVCDKRNQEPDIFAKLHSVGECPNFYASIQCTVHITKITSRTPKTVMHPTWYALVNDYAIQLHRILTKCLAVADIIIVGAVRAMIRAHSIGHIMSDNGFYNFGWLKGNVVIICDVSHCAAVMRRGEFNLKVTSKFWSNLRLLVHPTTLEKH